MIDPRNEACVHGRAVQGLSRKKLGHLHYLPCRKQLLESDIASKGAAPTYGDDDVVGRFEAEVLELEMTVLVPTFRHDRLRRKPRAHTS